MLGGGTKYTPESIGVTKAVALTRQVGPNSKYRTVRCPVYEGNLYDKRIRLLSDMRSNRTRTTRKSLVICIHMTLKRSPYVLAA
ncbi:hypothetical protein VTK73DRAFT_6722 [Phialemonium thermophilum]|uniref:Uncharacterized protein n=1 Tax=Phialemonium thermophilum TaxID=223376 RepID=A0ABR3XV71_9PEZI